MAYLIEGSDIAFVNQETVIAEGLYPLSGYPRFNSPKAAGGHLAAMGFNVINLSNNHMLDKNEDGLMAALDFWALQAGILTVGVFKDKNALQTPVVLNRQAVSAWPLWVSQNTPTDFFCRRVPLFATLFKRPCRHKQQVSLARAAGDFVVLSVHWD
jgi:poly-gamma-glutamate synthesis protein (capsule biosynthesis protein)